MDSNKRFETNVKNSFINGVSDNTTDGKGFNNSSSTVIPSIIRPYNKRKQKSVIATTVSSNGKAAIEPVISVTSANNSVSQENSSCNFQLFRCQLVNDQILFSDQTVKTYELQPIYAEPTIRSLDGVITTPTSSYTVPIVSTSEYFGGVNNTDSTNITTIAINNDVNNEIITSDVEIIDQNAFEKNIANGINEQMNDAEFAFEIIDQNAFEKNIANGINEQMNDAEFAFGRSVAIMLKKIQNVSARLAVQAKIYQVLGAELKVNV
ncbi:hypothetical protein QE152_g5384 [Popillia japonica]|uniref:Uncharacterized protein n=1 Tax=Popillia japonica TaxID=7064 RepID=A0AAW1MHW9_POPJA